MVRCSSFDVILFTLLAAGISGQYENCTRDLGTINDGKCNSENNIAVCGFDGGDCCECTCANNHLYPCGIGGFNCLDPDVVGGSDDCRNKTTPISACSMDSLITRFVNDTASATSLAEAINCSGGTFDVTWRGSVLIDHTIEVPDGTTVSLTGEDSRAEVNGGGKIRLFTAMGATLYIDNLVLRGGNATYGGAIAAARSAVFLNQTSCSGNIASSYGGAVYVGKSSTLVWDGQAMLTDNHAGRGGGAVVVNMNSTASWGGSTEFTANTITGDDGSGGAVYIRDHSRVAWDGATFLINNTVSSQGGALHVADSSTAFWDEASFVNNTASSSGGGFSVYNNSVVSWHGKTTFVDNTASVLGGAIYVYKSSSVSWHGVTSFINNSADDGGALNVYESSKVSSTANAYFINNTANDGGAFFISDNSIASWDGLTSFVANTAYHGGALFVYESEVSWAGMTFFTNNIASLYGGALYVYASSIVSWNGVTAFVENKSQDGGVMYIVFESIVSWDGVTAFVENNAQDGGVMYVVFESIVSWDGVTSFDDNTADNGGAFYVVHNSVVSWDGVVSFDDNSGDVGGALYISSYSNISWTATTSFINNAADYGGALAVASGSTVSWTGETSFTGNNAIMSGGAIYAIAGSSITLAGDTYFRKNIAGMNGGASYVYVSYNVVIPSNVIIDNDTAVLFHGNKCGANGGGIAVIGAVGTQFSSNMTFSENSAGVAGGAVYISGVNFGLRLESTKFISNSAISGGGVYTTGSGTAITDDEDGKPQEHPTTLIRCEFIENKVTETGGALDSAAGIDLIVDTLFMRNTEVTGGALRLFGTTSLEGCEFIENLSDEDEGPGIFNAGVISEISSCSFLDNVYNCQLGSYLEYSEVDAPFNTVCKGCDTPCNECVVKGKYPMCHEDLEHSTATGGNVTLDFLLIEPGYWRARNTSITILECYRAKACLGGITGKEGYCKEGYEGPYCSVCSAGYIESLGFACTKCSDNIAHGIALAVVIFTAFILALIAFLSYMLSGKSEDADRGIVARLARVFPLQSVKIVIVVWQIVTQFSAVVNVVFPSVYQEFLDGVDMLNFDFTWVLSAGCIVDIDFHDRLLLLTLGPLVGMTILGVTYVAAICRSHASEVASRIIRRKHVSMVLLLTFLVYSPVSSTLFKTFACDDLDDGKVYLRADYQIECNSPKHKALMIYASFMAIFYVIGIPASYGVLLYNNHEALNKHMGREEDEAIKPITDLWKPYRPDRFYYEVIECMRRVLLTGALVFISPNTAAQVAVALMMATFFIFVSEAMAPHACQWDTWCSRMGHAIVFATMFLALLLKLDSSVRPWPLMRANGIRDAVAWATRSCSQPCLWLFYSSWMCLENA